MATLVVAFGCAAMTAQAQTTWQIIFDANGGIGGEVQWVDDGMDPTPPIVTRDGYTFSGWDPAIAPATADATYTAQWDAIPTSTITFDMDGGMPAIAPITQDEGTPVASPADPTKDGYTFQGWVPAVPATMPEDDMTCIAQWLSLKSDQTITFPDIGDKLQTDAVGLSATASSGLEVSFAVGSGPATIAGLTNLSFTGAGEVTIVASQAGDASWNPAPDVTNTVHVYALSANTGPHAGGNTITITNGNIGAITNVTVGGVAAAITGSGTSWVTITLPAVGSAGAKDITIQTSDNGDTTLAGAYTVNPAGEIVAYVYDTNQWTEVAGLPAGRRDLAAGVLNDALYAVGGWDGTNAYGNAYRFDGTNWTEAAAMPAGRYGLAAGVLNGRLYALGGVDGSIRTNMYRYDGTNWTEVAGLPLARRDLAVGVLNGALYALGGFSGSTRTNMWRYNGTNWTQVAGLPAARRDLAAAVLNDALYALGGYDGTTYQTNVWRYNGTTWTEVASLPAARRNLAAGVWDGALYAIGGSDAAIQTNVYRYDGTNWTEVASLPARRDELAAGMLDGALVAVGGKYGGARTNVYRYPGRLDFGVNPSSGSYTGGYEVVITGTNLGDGADVTSVTLCGVAAGIQSQSATQIVVTAGTSALAGLGDVRVVSTSFGETVKSDAFTYQMPQFQFLGTNGVAVADGAAASVDAGTDFGALLIGLAVTNTFSFTNGGNTDLIITNVAISGAGAASYEFADVVTFPVTNPAGYRAYVEGVFRPQGGGPLPAQVAIYHDGTNSPFIANVAGFGLGGGIVLASNALAFGATYAGGNPADQTAAMTNAGAGGFTYTLETTYGPGASGWLASVPTNGTVAPGDIVVLTNSVDITGLGAGTYYATNTVTAPDATNSPQEFVVQLVVDKASQAITFPAIGDQLTTDAVGLAATASSGLGVSFAVGAGPATITGLTNLTFTGAGSVSIVASQGGDANWNAAPDVTNTFNVLFVNHAPAGADHTVATLEDTPYAFTEADFGFTDPNDSPPNNFMAVKITTLPGAGTLTSGGIAVTNGQAGLLSPAGATWTARESSRPWRAVASSADGTKLIAAATGDQLYTSTDSGATWTARESNRNWYSVASSADGTKLVAGGWGSQIYTSTDSGTNWTARAITHVWSSVASSADGTKLVAAMMNGQIYTSTDSGTNWTARESAQMWSSVASSADGTKLVAAMWGGQLYVSTDSGTNWTTREIPHIWSSVASSADGTKLVAAVWGGPIYTSTDSGATWTARASVRVWSSVASSADGAKLVAVVQNGQVYTSTDSGTNWTARASNRNWRSVASSADGRMVVAVEDGGQIHASQEGDLTFTPAADDNGAPCSSFTFQVQDDGGTANGGVDLDPTPKTLTINVTPVPDDQTITFPAIGDKVTTDAVGLAATASSGLGVSFAVGSGPASIAGGTNLTFSGTGSVSIVASQAGDADWNAAPDVTNTFNVAKASATVFLLDLAQTYDGTARTVTATTMPAGLTVEFTYDGGGTAPTDAGTYAVTGTVNDAMYQGSAAGSLVVGKAVAPVTLGSLAHTYDGTPKDATATTVPAGLSVDFTYDGSTTPPTDAGTYAVTGTVNEVNYQGFATDTLVIGKAAAIVTLGSLAQTYDGTPKAATATTVPTGLAVDFTYDGSATAPTAVGSYAVTGTVNDVNHQGAATGNLVIQPIALDAYEADDSRGAAKAIGNGERQNRTIHAAGNEDWAKFTVEGAGAQNVILETEDAFVRSRVPGVGGDTELWLYDPAGTLVAYDNDGGNGTFSRITVALLAPGTYTLRVREYGNNGVIPAYTLRAAWIPVPIPADAYENDDKSPRAKTIANGKVQQRTIHVAGRFDWAKFKVGRRGARNLLLETSGTSGDTQLWIYWPNKFGNAGKRMAYDDNHGVGKFSRITLATLKPGTYYIKVQENGNNGTIPAYRLRLNWTTP